MCKYVLPWLRSSKSNVLIFPLPLSVLCNGICKVSLQKYDHISQYFNKLDQLN